jgi:ferritin
MIPISDTLIPILQRQVAHELRNELVYRSVASWAATKWLKGIQAYFSSQADGEAGHAKIIMGLLADANEPLAIPNIENIPSGFTSCEQIASLYIETEAATTAVLETLYFAAESDKAVGVSNIIQGMLTEQIEEEGSGDRFLNAVDLAGGNLLLLDLALR